MTNRVARQILLNPGPVTTTDTVKKSLYCSDICHRESEFTQLMQSIRQDLLKVVQAGDNFTSVLFAASGTGALEACLTSVVPRHKKVAILNNGSYGQRLIDIANCYGIAHVALNYPFDHPLPLVEIEKKIADDPQICAFAVVHHETSSGILNPLHELGALCARTNTHFIVDAMSSFSGALIDVNKNHIDFIISSSNKCLHGMPGLSFVIARQASLLETEGNARSFYFDLHQQYYALERTGQMPFTPPVQVVYALRQALDELFLQTLDKRIQQYHANYAQLEKGLLALGFRIITPEFNCSRLLMIVQFPELGEPYIFADLHDYLYQRGVTIYPKKLSIPNTFRLSCIGDLYEKDIDYFLQQLKQYQLQHKIETVE